ncbi:MAG: NAD(P)-binding protein [Alphaproteobacteria bacterium]|nr:NAD(P)-binding protein [Alphaproteobacteria bacterium]
MGQTIIIGSGLTGITCARSLADAGLPVRVLDKGRAVGGRMATRRVMTGAGALSFDHGAQYLRPRTAEFADVLARTGARPWPDATGAAGHVGVPGMSDIPRALGDGLSIQQNTEVTALARRDGAWHLGTTAGAMQADRVVMTVPAPQAMALLGGDHAICAALAGVSMAPCLALLVAFPDNSPRPFVSRQDPSHPLAWIAQDSTKPGRTQAAVTWVAQAHRAFSSEHLDATPEEHAARMLPLLAEVLAVDPAKALHVRAHRWRYAQAETPLGQAFLHSDDRTLYTGGDWCIGPGAEHAWQSGRAMAQDILEHTDVD